MFMIQEYAEPNFFADEGIELRKVDTSGGGDNIRTVLSGDAVIGSATGTPGIYASYRKDTGIRLVANMVWRLTNTYWYSRGDSKYESIDDCGDAKIGFSRPGSSTNMVALKAIQYLKDNDIHNGGEAVSTGGPPDTLTQVESGNIDVGWNTPPRFYEKFQNGDLQRTFTGADVPPFDNMTIRAAFSTQDWLENNAETSRSFWRAYTEAMSWAYDNVDAAAEVWANEMEEVPTDVLATAIERDHPYDSYFKPGEIRRPEVASQLSVDQDFIDEPLSDEELDEVIFDDHLPS